MEKFKNHIPHLTEFLIILVVIVISFKIIDYINNHIKENIIKQGKNIRLLKFSPVLSKLLKAIILFFAIATILQNHGYSITSLIAGFGITGLAVGFAAKETIANLFGSLSIIYDNVYDIGDYIMIDTIEGTVEEINLRSTKIRTPDNILTTIPNNIVANSTVQNFSEITTRRISETIGLVYETPIEKINEAIDILKSIVCCNIEIEKDYQIFLDKLDSSSINIKFIAYVKYPDIANLRRVKEEILKETITKFRENNIDFAFPSQTIYVCKNEN